MTSSLVRRALGASALSALLAVLPLPALAADGPQEVVAHILAADFAGERAGRPVLERIWRANLARLKAKAEREATAARLDARAAATDAPGADLDAASDTEVRATA